MAGTLNIFTRTLAAGNSLAFTGGEGLHSISVLCKTDNSGAAGITVLGTLSVGGTASNSITLLANESVTISVPEPYDLGTITITAGASSTGIVTAS